MQAPLSHCRAMLLAAGCAALLAGAPVQGNLVLEFTAPPENLLITGVEGEPLAPTQGQHIVMGRFETADFAVTSIAEVAALAPDGTPVPLLIEESSLYEEFGEIVSCRLAFEIPAATPATPDPPYTLVWGPEVQAQANRLVPTVAGEASRKPEYRGFRWRRPGGGQGSDISVATIEVVADSNADLYSLWYLLPMALMFVLLTVRKIQTRST